MSAVAANVARVLNELRAGRCVIVVDDDDREAEGDLVVAAQFASAETMAFVLRHTSGVVCVALPGERCDALGLPPMAANNTAPLSTAFTVSVDLRPTAGNGLTTGISAADRAMTTRSLADPGTRAVDLVRPGHMFPLRAVPGGVLHRRGHTEASLDLVHLAGLRPAALLCEVTTPDRSAMADGAQLRRLAREHDLALLHIADLVEQLRRGLIGPGTGGDPRRQAGDQAGRTAPVRLAEVGRRQR